MDKDKMIRLVKIAIMVVVGAGIWLSPCPEGLKPIAWKYFSAYMVGILGILLSPFSSPVVMLAVLAIYSMLLGPSTLLSGYASTTTWLVVSAFMISVAFSSTGLGKRMAYILIGLFGRTSLGLGYAQSITILILGLAIPSTTARIGGVIFPVFNNISRTLGSSAEDASSRKLASYLTMVAYHINLVAACAFLTGMAPNAQIAAFAKDILNVNLDWVTWTLMGIVPAIVLTAIIPYILYKIYAPEIKMVENFKELSMQGLKEMGPISAGERNLLIFFVIAVALWATTSVTKFNSTAIALLFLSGCLVFGCMSWESVRQNKGAWDTLIWYGAIIGLSTQLSRAGFFRWFADILERNFNFAQFDAVVLMLILVVGGVLIRYVFASAAAFTTAMIPVMYTIGLVGDVPALPLAMLCAACTGYGAMITHYSGACAPVLYGYGHVDMKSWWILGIISSTLCIAVYFLIALPYWKFIGLW